MALGFKRADLRDEFLIRLCRRGLPAHDRRAAGRRSGSCATAPAGRPTVMTARRAASGIRYDLPGDAAWLGTYGDWATARARLRHRPGRAGDARRRAARQGVHPAASRQQGDTRQAAIIADLEPDAARRNCAPTYQSRKQFCEVRKPRGFRRACSPSFWRWRRAASASELGRPFSHSVRYRRHELADQFRSRLEAARAGRPQGGAGQSLAEVPQVRADAVHARLGGQPGGLHPLRPSHAHRGR